MRRAFQRQGNCLGRDWRELHIVELGLVISVDLEPAILAGWRVKKVTKRPDDFPNMSVNSIATYIKENWASDIVSLCEIDPSVVDQVIQRYEARKDQS